MMAMQADIDIDTDVKSIYLIFLEKWRINYGNVILDTSGR